MAKILHHEIWETGTPRAYPIVVHEFRGDSEEEAHAVYLAHLETDAFLRGCVDDGEFVAVDANGRRRSIKCFVRWWYDDDGASDERAARAWIEARRGGFLNDTGGPPTDELRRGPSRGGFRPRVIEGGACAIVSGPNGVRRPPGHEDHDPNVCDVRTG